MNLSATRERKENKKLCDRFIFTTRCAGGHRGTEDFRNAASPVLRFLHIVLLSLVFISGSVYGAWPTYHGAPDLKGVSEAKLSGPLELAWRFNAGGEIYGTPVSDGEHIFVSAKKGRILALSLEGEKLWERKFSRLNDAGKEMPLRFEAPLVCAGGMVFAGSTRGSLIALDAANGEERWRYETGGIIIGSANLIDDPKNSTAVVLDQAEGALHGIDVETGKRIWKTDGVDRCDGAPGVGDEVIAFGSCLAKLHVYDHAGSHLKDIEVGGDAQIAGGVALDGGRAYAGVRDGGMLCFDLERGEVVWSSDESNEQTFSTPAVTETMVIYSSDNGWVYGVNKLDGATLWKFDTGAALPMSPVVSGAKVVFSADGVLYLLNLKNGRLVWSKEISDEISSPALIRQMVVVGADDGTVSGWRALYP